MQKIIIPILTIVLFSSCSQEVENPIADYCWPVVHCLLNFEDSVHYVRLGKTFSGTHLDEMINNPDSLYFREANVFFDLYQNDYIAETIQLELTNELERDPGIFPAKPFPLYKTEHPIKPGKIGLRIEIPELDRYVATTINVRGKPYFYYPEPGRKKILDFYANTPDRIFWDGAGLSETTVRLWYLEITENGLDTCKLDWTRKNNDFILWPNDWFEYMLYWIKDDYHVLGRRVISVDILANGGDYRLSQYNAQKDLVFDLIGTPFSNVTGAIGFVGSRAYGGIYSYMPDRQFLDSLSFLPRLERLKFIYN